MTVYIIITIIAYLIGSINFSVIISRKMAGFDVREKGSGNAGSTNVLRSVGKKAAALTLLCDILKGVVAIGIAIICGKIAKESSSAILVQCASIAVIIGHTFSTTGLNSVPVSLIESNMLSLFSRIITSIVSTLSLVLMIFTQMVSVGSVTAAILLPVLTIFAIGTEHYIVPGNYILFSIIMAAIVLFNHRSNIKRILEGKENKISFKKEQ